MVICSNPKHKQRQGYPRSLLNLSNSFTVFQFKRWAQVELTHPNRDIRVLHFILFG